MKKLIMIESTANEALRHIDVMDNISVKNRDCLRLLTEEMFSMCKEILHMETFDYELDKTAWLYSLRISAKTQAEEKAKTQFMSASSSKSTEKKGFMGVLGTALEGFFYGAHSEKTGPAAPQNSTFAPKENSRVTWKLSEYMEKIPQEQIAGEWDGIEKSILLNFADEVEIDVRNGNVEMTVHTKFSKGKLYNQKSKNQ